MDQRKGVIKDGEEILRNVTTCNKMTGKGDASVSNPPCQLRDFEDFITNIELGNFEVWLKLSKDKRQEVFDTFCAMYKALKVENIDDSIPSKVTPSDHIMQSMDTNTKSTSYAGAAGDSAKNQQKVTSNFRPLMADPVFDGVNIFIPCKVVKKVQSSFVRCLIETIHVEYEWRPPMCDICKIFGHVHDYFPKNMVSPPIVTTSNVVTPTITMTNDAFQMVGKRKKWKGMSKSTNDGQFTGPSVKQTIRYELKATASAPKKGATNVGIASESLSMVKTTGTSSKKDNITTSNSCSALNDEDDVENVYDESDNIFTKIGGSSSFTAAADADIAKITRKQDKNRHENGKIMQEPRIIKKIQP
nr:hypothetical protein [Tanacetum cinerariifolium]